MRPIILKLRVVVAKHQKKKKVQQIQRVNAVPSAPAQIQTIELQAKRIQELESLLEHQNYDDDMFDFSSYNDLLPSST